MTNFFDLVIVHAIELQSGKQAERSFNAGLWTKKDHFSQFQVIIFCYIVQLITKAINPSILLPSYSFIFLGPDIELRPGHPVL